MARALETQAARAWLGWSDPRRSVAVRVMSAANGDSQQLPTATASTAIDRLITSAMQLIDYDEETGGETWLKSATRRRTDGNLTIPRGLRVRFEITDGRFCG